MAAPSNYLALNPRSSSARLETRGQSIAQGLRHLWQDVRQGHLSQTDESAFEGRTQRRDHRGQVVYENEFFQLSSTGRRRPRCSSARC